MPLPLFPRKTSPAGPSLPLEGERVRIRALEREDLDRRQAWRPFNDPLHLIWDMPPCSPSENDRWFATMTDGRHRLAYGVEDRSGKLIGMLSLREISWGRSARLGIAFAPTHVGQGYGTESLRLFLPYAFFTLGLERIVLDVAAANIRAVRCYYKVGFRQIGTFWQQVEGYVDPHLFDSPEYAPLRHFFRWSWGRTETLYYDMELRREDWEKENPPAG